MCKHTRSEVRKRKQINGVMICVKQCLDCYANLGAVPKSNYELDLLEWFDGASQENYWQQLRDKLKQDQQTARQEYTDDYHAYLQTEQWHLLRDKVMKRDGGICQGCLDCIATDVHHKTYAHIKNEFCFELIALCHACHKRFHGK